MTTHNDHTNGKFFGQKHIEIIIEIHTQIYDRKMYRLPPFGYLLKHITAVIYFSRYLNIYSYIINWKAEITLGR